MLVRHMTHILDGCPNTLRTCKGKKFLIFKFYDADDITNALNRSQYLIHSTHAQHVLSYLGIQLPWGGCVYIIKMCNPFGEPTKKTLRTFRTIFSHPKLLGLVEKRQTEIDNTNRLDDCRENWR